MRRVAILVLLYVGMQLIIPLEAGTSAGGPQTLLVFGFLVLAAYTVGELATLVTLPKITGYLFAGIVFGPSLLGIVTPQAVRELAPVNELAIALIAFLAGAELKWGELKAHGKAILGILGTELVFSFVLIVGALIALHQWVPFLQGTSMTGVLALAALFGAVAIVHSPSVMIAILTETRARGPVARTTLGVVLVADVVVVILFSAALALTRAIVPAHGTAGGLSAGVLAWEIGGSVIVGAILGGGIALYLRFVQRELLMFAIVVTFFGAAIAQLMHVETLLTLVVAGFITENATAGTGRALLEAMERSAAPVFVVFFALAGASIALGEVASIWPIALAIVAVRGFAIWSGATLGAKWSRASEPEQRYTWMGLVSQAGVAIGLVIVMADAYPSRGSQMRLLLLSVIAINQIIGPVLSRYALVRSGEAVESRGSAAEAAESRG
ncbi:MAG TPA: cation:proton antiporter [Gemmatimonadaceae bacterium]